MKFQALTVIRLMTRFFWHCALSGFTTAKIILRFNPPPAGLVKMKFKPMNQTGAAVLGALITLTPGSSALDINFEKQEILMHLLDKNKAQDTIAAIRRDFEQEICLLFPEKKV